PPAKPPSFAPRKPRRRPPLLPRTARMPMPARERKAAAAAIDDAHSQHGEPSVHGDSPGDLHGALLLHEAAALLNLHAQAIAVQNIRSLVLDVNSGSYSKWR